MANIEIVPTGAPAGAEIRSVDLAAGIDKATFAATTARLTMRDIEALPLIEELSGRVTSDKYIYRHSWKVGDLLLWDNALVQHWAPRDYEWPDRRLMLRTTVGGSKPQ